jgi:hypothetical protein
VQSASAGLFSARSYADTPQAGETSDLLQRKPSQDYSCLHPVLIKPTGFLSYCSGNLYAVVPFSHGNYEQGNHKSTGK